MLVVNAQPLKDATGADFSHYFNGTAMSYRLSPTKRRLFLVSGISGDHIQGSYLTREKEFKDKSILWTKWWEHLEIIVAPYLQFNVGDGGAIWYPRVSKNMKKSFLWNTNCLSFLGDVPPSQRTMQNIGYSAFSELYGVPKKYPRLEELVRGYPGAISSEGFSRQTGGVLYYKTAYVGKVDGGRVMLPRSKEFFSGFLSRIGVPHTVVTDDVVSPPVDHNAPIPMALNTVWVEGFHPNVYPLFYCVFLQQPGGSVFRTYKGIYPGHSKLLPGWQFYHSGGQA